MINIYLHTKGVFTSVAIAKNNIFEFFLITKHGKSQQKTL